MNKNITNNSNSLNSLNKKNNNYVSLSIKNENINSNIRKNNKDYSNFIINNQNNNKIIIHLDINNAFLSFSAVKLLNDGYPLDIREIPSIIAYSNNLRNGMVLAKSTPAKKFGIKTAMPLFQAFNLYPDLKIYSPDYSYYKKTSNKIHNFLFKYSDLVESASIDEWYLDLTGIVSKNNVHSYCQNIQKEIYNEFKITVNIGISNTKAIAKTISDFEKPNKIHMLFNEELPTRLWNLDISKLFLVGKKTLIKFKNIGINTIGDLATSNKKAIEKNFGKVGLMLYSFSRGEDNRIVSIDYEPPKSISNAITLEEPTNNMETLTSYLMQISENIGFRLREEEMYTNTIAVVIRYSDFSEKTKQIKIDTTNKTNDIFKTAIAIFNEIYVVDKVVRLLSIRLDNLQENNIVQTSLFDFETNLINVNKNNDNLLETKNNKLNKLNKEKKIKKNEARGNIDKVIDELNKQFGNNKLVHASSLRSHKLQKHTRRPKDSDFISFGFKNTDSTNNNDN